MSDYKLPNVALDKQQEKWVKKTAYVNDEPISVLIRRLIDEARKSK